ncbi:Aspyridones efflux protein apdF [Psilocybe cubensis]|uniref:Aspyridones efflux protein apdF n=1 Tax=Psilocybe cubensis TaxID=181762 RepID=A0ACB8GH48_PSICU|nr:Aspyridones efflux protein apdF [Psilocybe cubensis]KAH9474883.1 Aspyridones efflux protein apdF [Psilocybe cubensis]
MSEIRDQDSEGRDDVEDGGAKAWISITGAIRLQLDRKLSAHDAIRVRGRLWKAFRRRVLSCLGDSRISNFYFVPQQYLEVFLSQGVGMGLGLGLTFVPTLSLTVHHFRRRKVLATGIAMSGSSLGAVLFPISKHGFITPDSLSSQPHLQ